MTLFFPPREHYIRVTRYSVLRHLVMQEGFLRADEKKEFEKFSQALDNAIVSKYHGVLQEVKVDIHLACVFCKLKMKPYNWLIKYMLNTKNKCNS